MRIVLAALYLALVVAANLVVSHFGPSVTPVVAFAAIGPTLTIRDALHRQYGDRASTILVLLPLVLAGAAVSYFLGSPAVAAASAIAFTAAELVDGIVYVALRRFAQETRVTASNVVGAAVDSVLFPTLAFGGVLWGVTREQFFAKVAGGAIWALILHRQLRRQRATRLSI